MDVRIYNELVEIKKLLILQLISAGVSDVVIGKILGVSSARIRQIVPIKAAKKRVSEK